MALARGSIDADAERVVRKLARHGHKAYLVGGCVRDLLLGRTPKDFDVATSATPNEIRHIFRNCRIIGRRFQLAHIFFGAKIIETSTFRASPRHDDSSGESLLIRRDNVFGSDTEDARRRDFTINGLFYDVQTEQVIDHVEGLADLQAGLVRTIGDPSIRFREDPVRMLRAIKFAARLGFTIEPATYDAILQHRHEINQCAPPRVLEEFYRLLRGGAARRSMDLLTETGIDEVLAHHLAAMFRKPALDHEEAEWFATWADEHAAAGLAPVTSPAVTSPAFTLPLVAPDELAERREVAWCMLDQLDLMVAAGHELSNVLLLCALINPFLVDSLTDPGVRASAASEMIYELSQPLVYKLRVAKRDVERMRQVLLSQRRLAPTHRRRGRSATARRDGFDETLIIHELTARAVARDTSELDHWRGLRTDSSEGDEYLDGFGKRRRRRRGGRRHHRGGEDDLDGPDLHAAFG